MSTVVILSKGSRPQWKTEAERAVYGAVQHLMAATSSCTGKVVIDNCALNTQCMLLFCLWLGITQMRNVKILLLLAGWRVHGYVWHDGRNDGKRGELFFLSK